MACVPPVIYLKKPSYQQWYLLWRPACSSEGCKLHLLCRDSHVLVWVVSPRKATDRSVPSAQTVTCAGKPIKCSGQWSGNLRGALNGQCRGHLSIPRLTNPFSGPSMSTENAAPKGSSFFFTPEQNLRPIVTFSFFVP